MSISCGKSLAGCMFAMILASAASADVPKVATDIAPVHGLVARVMAGLGDPALIVEPGASPHNYSMRPSEARALEQADAVFWIGAELEPWLDETIETLASDAVVVELLGTPRITTLEFREGTTFEDHEHDHGAEGEGHSDHGHGAAEADGGHAEHATDHEAEGPARDKSDAHGSGDHVQAESAHGGEGPDGHGHAGLDPHAWLDPENGKVWLDLIAEELAALDPENADTYRANAAAGRDEIDAAMEEARDTLSVAGGIAFVVFHDAYHYFENRFGISAAGAISLSDASDPSPARIEEVRDTVAELDVDCIFAEPQFDQRLAETVAEGTDARVAVIDPLGVELETGSGYYPALIRSVAGSIAGCVS